MNRDDARWQIFDRINQERVRQDAKWGEQNHPDIDPRMNDLGDPIRACDEYEIPTAYRAQYLRQERGRNSAAPQTWGHVLVEWLSMTIEAATLAQKDSDPIADATVDRYLIKCAAVCVAWIEARQRRRTAT